MKRQLKIEALLSLVFGLSGIVFGLFCLWILSWFFQVSRGAGAGFIAVFSLYIVKSAWLFYKAKKLKE